MLSRYLKFTEGMEACPRQRSRGTRTGRNNSRRRTTSIGPRSEVRVEWVFWRMGYRYMRIVGGNLKLRSAAHVRNIWQQHGHYELEVKVGSSAMHALPQRQSARRLSHIDSRVLWMEDLVAASCARLKNIPREVGCGGHTGAPAKTKEVRQVLVGMGSRQIDEKKQQMASRHKCDPIATGEVEQVAAFMVRATK